eukprot:2598454-Prymnesium_polylepis.1
MDILHGIEPIEHTQPVRPSAARTAPPHMVTPTSTWCPPPFARAARRSGRATPSCSHQCRSSTLSAWSSRDPSARSYGATSPSRRW